MVDCQVRVAAVLSLLFRAALHKEVLVCKLRDVSKCD